MNKLTEKVKNIDTKTLKEVASLLMDNFSDGSVGAEAVGAFNEAQKTIWDNRPECCGKKVSAFDEGAYICDACQQMYE